MAAILRKMYGIGNKFHNFCSFQGFWMAQVNWERYWFSFFHAVTLGLPIFSFIFKDSSCFFFFTPFLFSFSFLLFFFFSNSNCTHSSLYQNHSWPWKLQFCYRSQLLNISFYKKLINKIWSNRWIPIGQGRNSNQCRGQEEWTREREMIWNTCPEHTMWNWTDTHSLFGQRNSRRWINDHLESRFCS